MWILGAFTLSILLLSACGGQDSSSSPAGDEVLARGELVFQANCAACHSTTLETIIVGPSFIGLASRAGEQMSGLDARAYIKQSILEPGAYVLEGFQNLMPDTYANSLSDDDLDALIEYLMTLD